MKIVLHERLLTLAPYLKYHSILVDQMKFLLDLSYDRTTEWMWHTFYMSLGTNGDFVQFRIQNAGLLIEISRRVSFRVEECHQSSTEYLFEFYRNQFGKAEL